MLPSVVISSSVIQARDTDLTITPNITFGAPRAIVTWLLNDRALAYNDTRVSISNEGALTVMDIGASDEGIYTVVVTNVYGADNDSVAVERKFGS
jgi:hypothetical protein